MRRPAPMSTPSQAPQACDKTGLAAIRMPPCAVLRFVAAYSRSSSFRAHEDAHMKNTRESAVPLVPYVVPSVCLCSSSSLSSSSPLLEPKFQASTETDVAQRRRGGATLPAYQGVSRSNACERGDLLMSLTEIDLSLAISTARRLTATAYSKPGLRWLDVKGDWLSAKRRRPRPLQPRCRTFGCSLPDLHAGLHQVATAFL